MSYCNDNRWIWMDQNEDDLRSNNLNNLAIKEIQFRNQNDQQLFRPKLIKHALPSKINHQGYYKTQQRTKKLLPGISIKLPNNGRMSEVSKNNTLKDKIFTRSSIRNTRNSQILNSLIEILKTETDHKVNNVQPNNEKLKTDPNFINEFTDSRDISSVKNSRVPKIISNQIMMLGSQNGVKRKLVSQQKSRNKIFNQQSYSWSKPSEKKLANFDEMQMTFYKPIRGSINQNQKPNPDQSLQKIQINQFIQ